VQRDVRACPSNSHLFLRNDCRREQRRNIVLAGRATKEIADRAVDVAGRLRDKRTKSSRPEVARWPGVTNQVIPRASPGVRSA